MAPWQDEEGAAATGGEVTMIRPAGPLPITEECKHYVDWNEVPNHIKK